MQQVYKQSKNGEIYLLVLEYTRLYIIMIVIYCYLECEDYKVLVFHTKISLTLK